MDWLFYVTSIAICWFMSEIGVDGVEWKVKALVI